MKHILVMAALILVGFSTVAASGKKSPELQYVGGFSICAKDADQLKEYYEKIGITFSRSDAYGHFGGFQWDKVDFHFGLYQKGSLEHWCHDEFVITPSFGISFRVNDFDGYVAMLKTKGLEPFDLMLEEPEGRFALYMDPEGNVLSIWGL